MSSTASFEHPSLEPSAAKAARRRAWVPAAIAGWLALVAASSVGLAVYKERAGDPGDPIARFPSASSVTLAGDRPTLVVFAHPFCPCTRATIAELAKITSRLGTRVSANVLFIRPSGTGAEWAATDLWAEARAIPGVEVMEDAGGAEAARFGARTSGEVMLFDARGDRLFAGGITAARGHEGDSPGDARVIGLVEGREVDSHQAPVFGCPLDDPDHRP